MNPGFDRSKPTAFTLLELLIVIAIIVILAAMILPMRNRPDGSRLTQCLGNEKQLALSLILFSSDHADSFPSRVSVTNGGAAEPMAAGDVVPAYLTITNFIRDPNHFLCPLDKCRLAAHAGQPLTHTNLSYFVSLDASATNTPTYTILTGDRNLESGGEAAGNGLFALSTNPPPGWTLELHHYGSTTAGTFSFADGHAETVKSERLQTAVARQPMQLNRVVIP